MPIQFNNIRNETDKKSTLNAIVDCITEAEHKRNVRAILIGQGVQKIMELLQLRPEDIETITLREEALDDKGNKIITSTPATKTCISTIKDLRDFAIFLGNDPNAINAIKDLTSDMYEAWSYNRLMQPPVVPVTPGTPAVGTPVPAPAPVAPVSKFDRKIEAIDKMDTGAIPKFDGSVGNYPRVKRNTKQVLKNYQMVAHIDPSLAVPTDPDPL